MNKEDISVQLYTARKFQPYNPIFDFLSESGIINIELFGLEKLNVEEFRVMMDKKNITSHSTHVSFESLKESQNIIDRAKWKRNTTTRRRYRQRGTLPACLNKGSH